VWYVNLESVKEYRKTKHTSQKKKPAAVASTKKRPKSIVEPVVRPKTVRTLKKTFAEVQRVAKSSIQTNYSSDDVSVIPVLRSESRKTSKKRTITPKKVAPSIKIKVQSNSKKSIKYFADKTPEISLQSKLNIKDISESDEVIVDEKDNSRVSKEKHMLVSTVDTMNISTRLPEKTDLVLHASDKSVSTDQVDHGINQNIKATHSYVSNNFKWAIFCVFLFVVVVITFALGVSYETTANGLESTLFLDWDFIAYLTL